MAQSSVNDILQDSSGFMWFGTQGGLSRYDGYDFVVYKNVVGDPTSLAHNRILALTEDPTGDLWIGTEGGGLARWRRKTDSFTYHRHNSSDPKSLSGDRVIDLTFDDAGELWVATMHGGLSRFDATTDSFRQFRHDPSDAASIAHNRLDTVYVDSAGNLWIGTAGGLDLFNPERERFVHYRHDPADSTSLSDDRVRAIVEDRQGRLWVGTRRGLNRFDRSTGTFERYLHSPGKSASLSNDWVRSLYQDRDGRLWVGTDGGLNLWRETSASFVGYYADQLDSSSLGSNQILTLFQGQGGVMWVSTLGAGVSKCNPDTWSFSHYKSEDNIAGSNLVFAISEDSEGALWVGTLGGGVERIQRDLSTKPGSQAGSASVHRIRYRHNPRDHRSLSDDQVTALYHDRRDSLWIGTLSGGLNLLGDGGAFEHYRSDPEDHESLSSDAVTSIYQDLSDRLWIGTHGGGLNLHLGSNSFRRFQHDSNDPASLGNDVILAIAEDRRGMLWLASDGGGLNRFQPETGVFLRVEHDLASTDSLSSNEVNVVHIDPSGRLWAGTEGSGLDQLLRLNEETGRASFRHFSRSHGLPDETVWGIRSDLKGTLWLSTNHGLVRFEPNTEMFWTYTRSDGLQANEFNLGAHFSSPSGELFFGGIHGLNAFFPDRIVSNTHVPPVVLTGLTRFNEPMALDKPLFEVEEVALSYRDYFLMFEFAALDFTAPEENRYRYRLGGFDDGWVELGTERRITITNLAPGRYTLRAQGSNNDGVWNEEGASIRISIAPPPWATWWAYALYGLGIASLLAGVFRWQRGWIERKKEEELRELDRKRREKELAVAESWALMLVEKNQQVEEKNQEILCAQAQLVQSEKMAALGQMVAGVAHEINNPVNFITSGLPSLRRDVAKLAALVPTDKHDERFGKVSRRVAKLFEAIGDGARRTAETVRDLRAFARLDEAELKVADLHAALDTTLALLRNQTKNRIEVVKSYGEIPPVECYPGQLNQVFMNLLINAAQAIEGGGTITITTAREGDDHVRISIRDSGCGMTDNVREKIFDPFFTTKPVGEGTGLGLSISHGIVDRHQGTIRIESQPGEGTEFTIILPIWVGEHADELF